MVRGPRDEGQALVLALFVLVLVAAASALVAADLQQRLRTDRLETIRMSVRGIEDGAIAHALATLAETPWNRADLRGELGGGVYLVRFGAIPRGGGRGGGAARPLRVRVTVVARLGHRRALSELVVAVPSGADPVVLGWSRERPRATDGTSEATEPGRL